MYDYNYRLLQLNFSVGLRITLKATLGKPHVLFGTEKPKIYLIDGIPFAASSHEKLLGMIHIWHPKKIVRFSRTSNPLSIYVQNSSTPLNSSNEPPLQVITNQLKENIIQGWLLYIIRFFLQVSFRFLYQLINLVWLSFGYFSFTSFYAWAIAEASLSAFSWL